VAKPARAADAVEVGLGLLGEVEVDDHLREDSQVRKPSRGQPGEETFTAAYSQEKERKKAAYLLLN